MRGDQNFTQIPRKIPLRSFWSGVKVAKIINAEIKLNLEHMQLIEKKYTYK